MMKQGPLSGQTLGGKYVLGDLLGKGGFGAVYKAENRMLRRQQAVKVLLEEHFSEAKFRDRFLREAQTLAALDHANIVHVDDIGLEGNLIYLVMPYISGGTLQDILKARSGPLGLDMVTRYLEQICSALGYAHAQGVVHLDLKPLNLLAHQDGRLLLSDFGLAHLMEQGAIEGGTSLQFGSPLYMAPEHFEGNPSQRSDIYALGVILYQMLTGRHPFEASTPAAIMRKHLTEPPPPLRAVWTNLPPELEGVVAKALAKQPEQRYGRAGELLVDFRAALGGQASKFASAAEQTRLSQSPLATTIRAANPPLSAAGPTLAGSIPATPASVGQPFVPQPPPAGVSGPAAPRPISVPVPAPAAPGKLDVWSPGFTRLFVLAAIAGGIVMLIIRGNAPGWIILLVLSTVVSVCLVGLRFAHSKLLRGGLLLQVGALVSNIIALFALNLNSALQLDLSFASMILNAASLAVISYVIAPWQGRQDIRLTGLQVIVSIISAVLLGRNSESFYSWWLSVEAGTGLIVTVTVTLFAAAVFLLRPASWKQERVVTLLLSLSALLFALLFIAPALLEAFFLREIDTYLLSRVLLMLGFLLLIQTERVRKKAQQGAAPALAGQAAQ